MTQSKPDKPILRDSFWIKAYNRAPIPEKYKRYTHLTLSNAIMGACFDHLIELSKYYIHMQPEVSISYEYLSALEEAYKKLETLHKG